MDLERTFPLQTIRRIRCVALVFLLAAIPATVRPAGRARRGELHVDALAWPVGRRGPAAAVALHAALPGEPGSRGRPDRRLERTDVVAAIRWNRGDGKPRIRRSRRLAASLPEDS